MAPWMAPAQCAWRGAKKMRAGSMVARSSDAEECAGEGAATAGDSGAADDDGGNDLEFESFAGVGVDQRRTGRR